MRDISLIRGILGLVMLPTLLPAGAINIIDVIGNLPTSDYNTYIAPVSNYKDWGNEPFIAVNPTAPSQIVVSSFGYGTSSTTAPGASIWYSTNSGANWGLRAPITAPNNNTNIPEDWTFAYDSSGTLHGTVLGGSNTNNATDIFLGSTTNPNNDNVSGRPNSNWTYTNSGGAINQFAGEGDQPYMALNGTGKLVVGYDTFDNTLGVEEQAAISSNNGTSFINTAISRGFQLTNFSNPGTRTAVDQNGDIFAIFGVGTGQTGDVTQETYQLNRYTSGSTWDYTNSSTYGGLTIDSGNSRQITSSGGLFAGVNQLLGNITAIATDATGTHVYTVYGKEDNTGTDRLYLAEFTNIAGNLVERANPVAFSVAGQRTALPSITVLSDGELAILYDAYSSSDSKVHVHVATSSDLGLTFGDQDIYDFAPLAPGGIGIDCGSDPNICREREFGDYQKILSMGNTYYGVFAGAGNVNAGGINTTDLITPMFFTETVPEPVSAALVAFALAGLALRRWRETRAS